MPLTTEHIETTLGLVQKDENGKIVSAKAMVLNLVGQRKLVNGKVLDGKDGDPDTLDFETKLIDLVNDFKFSTNLKAVPLTQRSIGDITSESMKGDLGLLALGYGLVIAYVVIMLGKYAS